MLGFRRRLTFLSSSTIDPVPQANSVSAEHWFDAFTRRLATKRSAGALLALTVFAAALAAQTTAGIAQAPVPGGATAASVFCIQAGDLKSGALADTFLMTGPGKWEQREYLKAGVFKFDEKSRNNATVELFDSSRGMSVLLDLGTRKIESTNSNPPANWTDLFYILNATDRQRSTDCVALASRSVAPGNTAAPAPRPGATTVVIVTVRPRTPIVIAPGTQLTATAGPPCPGQPGFFLCPNKFSCAPDGGVCCPGVGACSRGLFCDRFIAGSCISPADRAFCKGSENPKTGVSLHCAPGKTCNPANAAVGTPRICL
jgi:hypothetical protein